MNAQFSGNMLCHKKQPDYIMGYGISIEVSGMTLLQVQQLLSMSGELKLCKQPTEPLVTALCVIANKMAINE